MLLECLEWGEGGMGEGMYGEWVRTGVWGERRGGDERRD